MTDISKCYWINCKKKDSCYRFTAKTDSHYQAYINVEDVENCEFYINNNKIWINIYNM